MIESRKRAVCREDEWRKDEAAFHQKVLSWESVVTCLCVLSSPLEEVSDEIELKRDGISCALLANIILCSRVLLKKKDADLSQGRRLKECATSSGQHRCTCTTEVLRDRGTAI